MLEIYSGIRSQIKQLKDRLKGLNTKKHKPADVKSLLDDLEALEKRYEQDKAKRDEKKKLKETQNEKAPEETRKESKEAPKETVEASESAPVDKEPKNRTLIDFRGYPIPEAGDKTIKRLMKDKESSPQLTNKYNIDDKVMPVRGEKSIGRVMRHDMYVKHKETGKEGIVISYE